MFGGRSEWLVLTKWGDWVLFNNASEAIRYYYETHWSAALVYALNTIDGYCFLQFIIDKRYTVY